MSPVIATVHLRPFAVPLRAPWVDATGTLSERAGWLVGVVDRDGVRGWGECAPLPSIGGEDAEAALAALNEAADNLPGLTPEAAFEGLAMEDRPVARAGVETALLDLIARRRGVPLSRLLARETGASVAVNAVLGALADDTPALAEAALARGFTILKVKLGRGEPGVEVARLRRLALAVAGRGRLRLDANRAWDETTARRALDAVPPDIIDAVEEPLANPSLERLARLQAAWPFALAIDESLGGLGVAAAIAFGAARRLVLKPALLGGLVPAAAIARAARAAGVEVVVTSLLETEIGLTAAAHLAAGLPGGLAHGLATLDWLEGGTAQPRPEIASGRLWLPAGPGLGVVREQPA